MSRWAVRRGIWSVLTVEVELLEAKSAGAISLLALVISLSLAAIMISFGAFSLVNLLVIKHFLVDQRQSSGSGLIRYGLLPDIGFLLIVWLWTSFSATTFEVGLTWVTVDFLYLTQLFSQTVPGLTLQEALDGKTAEITITRRSSPVTNRGVS